MDSMFAPVIKLNTTTQVDFAVILPKFELTVDTGDGLCVHGNREYQGLFETAIPGYSINFYGPTPEHVIGLAHVYALKLTEGKPYDLTIDLTDEVPAPQVP